MLHLRARGFAPLTILTDACHASAHVDLIHAFRVFVRVVAGGLPPRRCRSKGPCHAAPGWRCPGRPGPTAGTARLEWAGSGWPRTTTTENPASRLADRSLGVIQLPPTMTRGLGVR